MYKRQAHHTGQPLETIERDMDRDRFMSADEARAYGLIDQVFAPRKLSLEAAELAATVTAT